MRTTSFLSSEADRTVNLQIYRTDEALFIYQPSRMAAFFKKGFRIALYVSLGILALMALSFMMHGFSADTNAYFIIQILCAMPFMYLGLCALLLGGTNYLLRIDSSHIVITSSWFGIRSTKQIERPDKLELYKDSEPGYWRFKGLPSSFPAAPHEIGWLRKVFDEFSA